MRYSDLNTYKKAFIFELDDVLFPAKDYYYQVYYLFAALLEYTGLVDAKAATDLMINTYNIEGKDKAFDRLQQETGIEEKYRANLNELLTKGRLPLKLLLYQNMLNLLQEMVVDRKKIFIVTNGDPQQQLNKIKQVEWNGLENYLTAYFADEIVPKPAPDAIEYLLKENSLQKTDLLMIGNTEADHVCALACNIDYVDAGEFLN